MVKVLGLDIVPLNVPLERRLQTASVLHMVWSFLFMGLICFYITFSLLFTSFFYIPLLYMFWFYKDSDQSWQGGRRINWVRRLKMWDYFRDYFPINLIKTVDLDSNKNYIFGYHPHGVLSAGAFCNFATEATGFSEKFPGIIPHLLTLKMNFCIPYYREYLFALGLCDVSKESIEWILTKEGKGSSAIIVIGGAAESLDAHPGMYTLTLKNRKGFVKLALKHGASLVPVFSFGENELFLQVKNPKGSILRNIQNKMSKVLGFAPPLFHGRGVFNYTFGIIPFRKPVNTIVGKPIDVEKIEAPTQEDIDKYHQLYMDGLKAIFDEHKSKYGIDETRELQFD